MSIRSLATCLFALLFGLGATACSEGLETTERELLIRFDSQTDTLEVLHICQGVHLVRTRDEDLRYVERLLDGARIFDFSWPFQFDLDDDDAVLELSEADRALVDNVSVLDVSAYLDDQRRMSYYQHVVIARASALMKRLNGAICASLVEESEDRKDSSEAPSRTWLLSVEAAREGRTWVRFDDEGRLHVDAPLADEDAPRFLREFLKEAETEEDLIGLHSLAEALSRVTLGQDRAQLTFGDGTGPVRFRIASPDVEVVPRLDALLAARGTPISPNLDLEALRGRLNPE